MGQAESTVERPEAERFLQPGDGPLPGDRKLFKYTRGRGDRARLYVYDRVRGASRYKGYHTQPPARCCAAPPCVYLCSTQLEQNACCEYVGEFGCIDPDDSPIRQHLFKISLAVNLVSLCLLFYASFAIANQNYSILKNASFSKAEIIDESTGNTVGHLYLGLRAVAVHDVGREIEDIITFDDFCDEIDRNLIHYVEPGTCSACEDDSIGYVVGSVTAVILMLPSIFSSVTRYLVNYDVNCQKSMGCILGFLSLLSTISTMATYRSDCFKSFYSGSVYVLANGTVVPAEYEVPPDGTLREFSFNWRWGGAFGCTVLATCIRFIDVIMHAIVPTPSITRNHDEQVEYENNFVGIVVDVPDSGRVEPEPENDDQEIVNVEATDGEG